jgi:hypothetical protein
MAYLHQLLGELETELEGLRQEAGDDPHRTQLWRATSAEIHARAPAILRTPATALTAGNLDLLKLVAYTAASTALVQERRLTLRRIRMGQEDTAESAVP